MMSGVKNVVGGEFLLKKMVIMFLWVVFSGENYYVFFIWKGGVILLYFFGFVFFGKR